MKSKLEIIPCALAFVFGVVSGFYMYSHIQKTDLTGAALLESDYYAAHLELQLARGNSAAQEDAVRSLIALNEKLMARSSLGLNERMLATDSALAYARLATLATNRGASQESEQYINKAISYCPKIGWKVCSIKEINQAIEQLDKRAIDGPRTIDVPKKSG